MNIPESLNIICDFNGEVVQSTDNLPIKTIFELISSLSLDDFKNNIKNIIVTEDFLKIRKVKLVDGNVYYCGLELYDTKATLLNIKFQRCYHNNNETFWEDSIVKYDYYSHRLNNVVNSISQLLHNLFYQNRSKIIDILKDLSSSFMFNQIMLIFHNGKDHCIYGKDGLDGFNCDYVFEDTDFKIQDELYNKNVQTSISDNLKIKLYKDTTLYKYCKDENISENRHVFVLKLLFGPTLIGYMLFVPHSSIYFTKTELSLIESLSTILAYVIHNKCEQLEIENYIRKKFSLDLKLLKDPQQI